MSHGCDLLNQGDPLRDKPSKLDGRISILQCAFGTETPSGLCRAGDTEYRHTTLPFDFTTHARGLSGGATEQ